MSQTHRLSIGFAALIVLLTGDVLAQSSAEDKAVAESLFRDAKRLMEQSKIPEACRKLEESQRLDPAAGTQLNLAVCHEKEGKIATAWGEFVTALAQARRDRRSDREDLARQHIQSLEPQLPKLTIEVPASCRVRGLLIIRNGTTLQVGAWDTAIPIDPGEVRVEAKAPEHKTWTTTLQVAQADNKRVTVPALESDVAPLPLPAAVVSAVVPVAESTPAPAGPVDKGQSYSGSTKRVAGVIVGGLGIVSIGVGSYFGLRASALRSRSDDNCPTIAGALRCTQAGVDYNDDARTSARVADVTIGVGLVAVAAGAWLWFSAPSEPSSATNAGRAAERSTSRAWLPVQLSVGPRSNGAQATLQGVW